MGEVVVKVLILVYIWIHCAYFLSRTLFRLNLYSKSFLFIFFAK